MLSPEGYAATGGTVCPACGATTITHGPLRLEGSAVLQRVGCLTCQARWMAVYELTGYEHEAGESRPREARRWRD
jgi:hypothetical protein